MIRGFRLFQRPFDHYKIYNNHVNLQKTFFFMFDNYYIPSSSYLTDEKIMEMNMKILERQVLYYKTKCEFYEKILDKFVKEEEKS